MDATGLVVAALALLVGFALGALTVRGRTATLAAERNAARAERDTIRGERDTAHAELDDAEQHLRQAQADKARLEAQIEHTRNSADEKLALLRTEQERLTQEFDRLSNDALRRNRAEFLELATEQLKGSEERTKTELEHRRAAVEAMVKPLNEQLAKVTEHANELERARSAAYAELRTQVESMGQNSEKLRLETQQLVTALRAPQVRGRWGELQLRRVVEAAGMLEHVDFVEQATADTADGKLRPDMLVHLAGGKRVVVDAKVSFSGYLEAQEARDDATRNDRLAAHARHLQAHIDSLAGKQYWAQFAPTPEFVVMFVPSDVFLDAALQQDPSLFEHAFERNVVLATPATLVALLRTVGYTWRQEALARNAQQVLQLGRELHTRLSTMGRHVGKLGRQLDNAVKAYNETVSSLESRVLVTARKMTELEVVDDELESPAQVERTTRQIQPADLAAAPDQSLLALDDIDADPRYGVNAAGADTERDGTNG
ncbi:DNA recombination protein RmuC [Haloactinopolyspora alba]|uniref:DNA recombination protein RmuC n=1 Tax=Haloactinopolyspora alba TaxID=648780 RepID=A0A2P8DX60_9ACTN|nr:DNA recombination protein RmuC [Haloactinopolyspora alba]PSL01782.1 DNA recombination protein RmuC [Haloactinopolyspora alba]